MKKSICIDKKIFFVDSEGFLIDQSVWSKKFAIFTAKKENILLTKKHWDIIYLVRNFYHQYDIVPGIKILSKLITKKFFFKNINFIFFVKLFCNQPIKNITKISGLPKNSNCI